MTTEKFKKLLLKYFQNGCLSKSDNLFSFIFSSIPFYKNAKQISVAFQQVDPFKLNSNFVSFKMESYSGTNNHAKKISSFLKSKIEDDLIGAYVNGSIAVSEEVSYTDFDGFVILKNEILKDEQRLTKVAIALHKSEQFMFEMDPLQHHGWFILTEDDLNNYPEYYFPSELFRFSKCLFGEKKIQIHLRENGYKKELEESFYKMAQHILDNLRSKIFLRDYYSFKGLLSEFMLLPAIYLQAKTGNGIFKKFSFEKLKEELKEKYSVMDEISSVRLNWNYKAPLIYKFFRNRKVPIINIIPSKCFSGKLPLELKNKFDEKLIQQMKSFVNELKINLKR